MPWGTAAPLPLNPNNRRIYHPHYLDQLRVQRHAQVMVARGRRPCSCCCLHLHGASSSSSSACATCAAAGGSIAPRRRGPLRGRGHRRGAHPQQGQQLLGGFHQVRPDQALRQGRALGAGRQPPACGPGGGRARGCQGGEASERGRPRGMRVSQGSAPPLAAGCRALAEVPREMQQPGSRPARPVTSQAPCECTASCMHES